ncbi:MAG: 6,7-dimethyl-8-ribityllumazine synthase [Phycisphaeraceae bacterium]
MPHELEGNLLAADARIAIVVARFNDYVTKHMLDNAVRAWHALGGRDENITIAHVPGSFELPVTALNLAQTKQYHSIICLGCVIRGETDHYDHVVEQTAKGIKDVGVSTGIPCIFGVLTCDTLDQAINRAGAKMGNAGRTFMLAGIEMANLIRKINP